MNCLSSTCVPLSKYIFMWTSSVQLKEIFDMSRQGLNSIPEETARMKVLKSLEKGHIISCLVIVNQASSHLIYLSLPLLMTIFGNSRYLPTIPGEILGFSGAEESPYFEIAFALIFVATAFSAINQTGYIVLFVTLLSHELGHIYAMTETLNQIQRTMYDDTITKVDKEKSVDENLRFYVKHHQFFMRYHAKIRGLYRIIFGFHFLLMTIVLVTTLQTLNAWNLSNTILTGVTGVLPLFIYCFGGELLFSAEGEMSKAAYSCGWELMEAKQAKIVSFVSALSQRPLYLTAADVFIMNRDTFGRVVQVVYKIYAVFN
ncbi:odorant receptor 10a-like [Plodia interpunctella]|uniref:odorant receptor 10a-like n=1 Tax=Plodia interpunctella TaxID=58824 RepID=UPI003100D512